MGGALLNGFDFLLQDRHRGLEWYDFPCNRRNIFFIGLDGFLKVVSHIKGFLYGRVVLDQPDGFTEMFFERLPRWIETSLVSYPFTTRMAEVSMLSKL